MVVGVDIGTTSAKAAAFDADGTMQEVANAAYPMREPNPGWAEQDPEQVVDAVLQVMREALGAAPRAAGIAFSTAMHSLVGLDGDGRPATPLVTWADTRALQQAEWLREHHPELHDRTGTPLHPMAPLPKLRWFSECGGADGVARWCGIKDLVVQRLTGAWVMDHSAASGTGLMDIQRLAWDPEALELAGVRQEQLPQLVPVDHVLDWEVPMVAGAGDGPLANLGVGAVRPGVAAVSIGTSGALRVMVEDPAVDDRRRTFCYALTPGRWIIGGAINNGGATLEWVREALTPDLSIEDALAAAADVPPGSEGLVMLPYLYSERAPVWSAVPRGAYVGLTHRHGRGHLVRAAIEGVCQQLALVLASVRASGYEVREVRATGGFARSALWKQVLADALGTPVGFPEGHEGSAFGAALVGMEALGVIDSIDLAADLVRLSEVVEPEPAAAAVYERLRPTFEDLAEQLGPAFLALREEGRRDR